MAGLQLSILSAILVSTIGAVLWWSRHRELAPLPPGPPGHLFIGHILKFPPDQQYALLKEWAARYGDIFRLNMIGQPLIVVNSYKVAMDLMEKRSANYSDRPPCHMMDLIGFERSLIFFPYGDRFRKHRRMFQETFNSKRCIDFRPLQTRSVVVLLKRLLAEPHEYHSALQSFVLRVVIEIAYGHRVDSDDNLYVRLFKEAAPAMEEVTAGVAVLDFFPWLAHVPPWVPVLSRFANVIRQWRIPARASAETPFNDARAQLAAGVSNGSFTAFQLQALSTDGADISIEDLKEISGAASSIMGAGTETTVSAVETFLLAMVLFPEAQRKAQEEIDSVVGTDRWPDSSDRDDLPFMECLLEEVSRWHPVAPLAIPHRSVNDDVYDGFFIPARSMIIPNVQVMAKDPAVYTNPEVFYPERFLPSPAGYGEPYFDAAFGFGRRVCPGRHLAKDTFWIACAMLLATFDIRKAVGPDGQVIEPHIEWVTGAQTSPPKHFKCSIKPRSERVERMILLSTTS